MSKFLEGVDEHTPEKDLDEITAAKRELQNMLLKADIMADAKAFKDEIFVKLTSGKIIKLEIIDVKDIPAEDQEMDIEKMAKTVGAVLSIPSQGVGKQLLDPSARQAQLAKRTLSKKLVDAAKSIKIK